MRILAFAYACEPGKGSEPGAGWELARMVAREIGETWVITRENNRQAIEDALASLPEADRLRFEYVDLPRSARFWKRGQRGVWLYYLLWMLAALRRGRQVTRTADFDLVWHLTLANAWLGTTAPFLGLPFVYGPVGGGVSVPFRLLPALGVRGAAHELARALARFGGRYLNPLARAAWHRARVILVQNPETRRWLPARHQGKTMVFPNAAALEVGPDRCGKPGRPREGPPVALFAGRLLPWKGLTFACRALQGLPDWRLVVIGSGPDERRLQRIVRRLGLGDRLEFRGWQPRQKVLQAMQEEADVFLFPSLHDEGGWVVAEALACGLAVVCLDRGGPSAVARSWGARPLVLTGCRGQELVSAIERVVGLPCVAFQRDAPTREGGPALLLEILTRCPGVLTGIGPPGGLNAPRFGGPSVQ